MQIRLTLRRGKESCSPRQSLASATTAGSGHPVWLEPAEWLGGDGASRHTLHLITNQPRTRMHSQFDNGALSTASKIAGREPLMLHADGASAHGIADGDVVRVFNDRGACSPARVSLLPYVRV